VLGIRIAADHWCNVNEAGFGVRPTAATKWEDVVDAFVWGKPGGESDGTSDVNSVRYRVYCGLKDCFTPMPDEGEWSQAYFEMLVRNARPEFK
jgi:cellulose 1,4-beta-cellobiosidase